MKNMKKILAGITLGIMVMGAAALSMQSVEAFSGKHGDGEHRGYKQGYHTKYADMTDEQKAELNSRHEQRMQWYKKDMQTAVDAGKMTQQEADTRIAAMQERFQAVQEGKFSALSGQKYADMTDAQKAEFNSRHEQRMQWYKKDLQIAVDAGKMTQQEADARLERMHSRFQDMQNGKVGMYGKSGHRDGKYNKDNKYSKGNHSYGNHNSDCLADCPR